MQVLEGAHEMAERMTVVGMAVDPRRLGVERAPRRGQPGVEIAVRRVDGGDGLALDPGGDEIRVDPRHRGPGILWVRRKSQGRVQAADTGGKHLERAMQR